MGIGVGHFFARRFDEARAMLLRSLQVHQSWVPSYRFLASCYAQMGRLEEAHQAIIQLQALTPLLVPSAPQWRNPEHRELYLSGLRRGSWRLGGRSPSNARPAQRPRQLHPQDPTREDRGDLGLCPDRRCSETPLRKHRARGEDDPSPTRNRSEDRQLSA